MRFHLSVCGRRLTYVKLFMLLGEASNIQVSKHSAWKGHEPMQTGDLTLTKTSGISQSRGTSLKVVSRTFPLFRPALQTLTEACWNPWYHADSFLSLITPEVIQNISLDYPRWTSSSIVSLSYNSTLISALVYGRTSRQPSENADESFQLQVTLSKVHKLLSSCLVFFPSGKFTSPNFFGITIWRNPVSHLLAKCDEMTESAFIFNF